MRDGRAQKKKQQQQQKKKNKKNKKLGLPKSKISRRLPQVFSVDDVFFGNALQCNKLWRYLLIQFFCHNYHHSGLAYPIHLLRPENFKNFSSSADVYCFQMAFNIFNFLNECFTCK